MLKAQLEGSRQCAGGQSSREGPHRAPGAKGTARSCCQSQLRRRPTAHLRLYIRRARGHGRCEGIRCPGLSPALSPVPSHSRKQLPNHRAARDMLTATHATGLALPAARETRRAQVALCCVAPGASGVCRATEETSLRGERGARLPPRPSAPAAEGAATSRSRPEPLKP